VGWSTKAAISLKRVKIEETLLWRAYRKSQTFFRTVPSRPPRASPSPRLGVCNPQKTKIYKLQIWQVYSQVHTNKSPLKIWEKRERGCIQGLPKFFEYPLLSLKRVKLRTSNLASIFTGTMQTKAP